jgi:hypothetical protein
MHAVTARLRKVPFHRVSTKPLRTPFGDVPVTWNTEPMEEIKRFADDCKPIFTRKCSCPLACGMCNCQVDIWLAENKNTWML